MEKRIFMALMVVGFGVSQMWCGNNASVSRPRGGIWNRDPQQQGVVDGKKENAEDKKRGHDAKNDIGGRRNGVGGGNANGARNGNWGSNRR